MSFLSTTSSTRTTPLNSAGTAEWWAHKELRKSPFVNWYVQHLEEEGWHRFPFQILKWVSYCLPVEHTSPASPAVTKVFWGTRKTILRWCAGLQSLKPWSFSPLLGERLGGPKAQLFRLLRTEQHSCSGIPPPNTRAGNKANRQGYFKNDPNDVN